MKTKFLFLFMAMFTATSAQKIPLNHALDWWNYLIPKEAKFKYSIVSIAGEWLKYPPTHKKEYQRINFGFDNQGNNISWEFIDSVENKVIEYSNLKWEYDSNNCIKKMFTFNGDNYVGNNSFEYSCGSSGVDSMWNLYAFILDEMKYDSFQKPLVLNSFQKDPSSKKIVLRYSNFFDWDEKGRIKRIYNSVNGRSISFFYEDEKITFRTNGEWWFQFGEIFLNDDGLPSKEQRFSVKNGHQKLVYSGSYIWK